MKKLLIKNNLDKAIKEKILNEDRIIILFFYYKYSFRNIFTSPLFLLTKGLSNILGKKGMDHTCHISKVVFDAKNNCYDLRIYEANWNKGVVYSSLLQRLFKNNIKIYYKIIDEKENVKVKKEFEEKYKNKKYGRVKAIVSGIDRLDDNTFKTKSNPKTIFCSWLASKYLQDQGYNINHIEKGNCREITPSDLWHGIKKEGNLLIES